MGYALGRLTHKEVRKAGLGIGRSCCASVTATKGSDKHTENVTLGKTVLWGGGQFPVRDEGVNGQHLILLATGRMGESEGGQGEITKYPFYIFSSHFDVLTQLKLP